METRLKLFQNYFTGLLQLMNIFRDVQCRSNNFITVSAAEFYFSFRRGYMSNKTLT